MATSYALEEVDSPDFFEMGLHDPVPAVDGSIETPSFRGQLDQIGLPSLLCILEMERKSGILVLIVEPELEQAHLHLSEGRVFRAHLERTEGSKNAELVYGLLARTRGTFDFRPSSVDLRDDVQCSTTRLLLEGARRIEESGLALGAETVASGILRVDGQDIAALAKRVPLENPPAPCRGGQNEEVPVDQRAPGPGKCPDEMRVCMKEDFLAAASNQENLGAGLDPSRRWALTNAVVAALLTACFTLVVLTTVLHSSPGASDSTLSGAARLPIPFSNGPTR